MKLFHALKSWFENLAYDLFALWLQIVHPLPTPVPAQTTEETLTNLIIARNGSFQSYYPSAVDPNKQVSACCHRVTPEVANTVARQLIFASIATKLPLYYLASCLYQESQWDPECFNHNLAEHKGVESFEGTDWGIAQNSGAMIKSDSDFAGLTEAQMIAKLFDPTWSIPHFARVMLGNTQWAAEQLQVDPSLVPAIHNLSSIYRYDWTTSTPQQTIFWMATVAYNRGRNGCLEMIRGQHPPVPHGHHVQTWMLQFAPILDPKVVLD